MKGKSGEDWRSAGSLALFLEQTNYRIILKALSSKPYPILENKKLTKRVYSFSFRWSRIFLVA
ncbi:MAG TPA: hypothetical protein PLI67_07670 [Niabella sp.]|nr:hypothetical protein [Niabella sp.]